MSTEERDYSTPEYRPQVGIDPYPSTEAGWMELYDQRWQMYLLSAYDAGVTKREHLFRAFDDSGNEMDQTRRLFGYFPFVADTDAAALAGSDLTLETADRLPGMAPSAQLTAGEAVWKRSRITTQAPRWFSLLCPLGDYWLEAQRSNGKRPYNTRIVGYDARTVTPVYDETGMELVSLRITFGTANAEQWVAGVQDPTVDQYERTLTRTDVIVKRNGKVVDKESGPHGLGVVPAVHLSCIPWDQPEHSLCAPKGIERAVMKLDSLATQISAIGNRYGNPTMVTYGGRLGGDSKVQRFGRMIDGFPAEGRVEYLEAKFAQIPHLIDHMREIHKVVRDTSPEFLFASDAAQESAAARSLRGQAFESKMRGMRGRVYSALAEVTALAVAMDADRAFDLGDNPYKIEAPPILPRNIAAEMGVLEMIRDRIKRADYVRHLQRLGMVGLEHDPEAYAAEVADEQAHRATAFFTEADPGAADGGGEAAAPKPAKPSADTTDAVDDIDAGLDALSEALQIEELPADAVELIQEAADAVKRARGAVGSTDAAA